MLIDESQKGRLLNKAIAYGKKVERRNKIKEVVSLAATGVGAVGVGLSAQGLADSPLVTLASMALFAAGASLGFYYQVKAEKISDALERMAEDSKMFSDKKDESQEVNIMYR